MPNPDDLNRTEQLHTALAELYSQGGVTWATITGTGNTTAGWNSSSARW